MKITLTPVAKGTGPVSRDECIPMGPNILMFYSCGLISVVQTVNLLIELINLNTLRLII